MPKDLEQSILESNKDPNRNDRRTWYICKVENVMDPEKRRRIQVRFAHEKEIPVESLQWCFPLLKSPADFELPDTNTLVFVIRFNDIYMYFDLPDKSNWSSFSDDDYPTAEMHKHKDVYEYSFLKSAGFNLIMRAVLNARIKNYEIQIDEDKAYWYFEEFGFRQTNKIIEIGQLGGGNARITIDLDTGITTFNDNALDSFMQDINKTVEKINAIESDLNQIKDMFKNWKPIPMDGGAALKAISAPWFSDKFELTTVDDIKDPLIKN
jgi:uncharacterized protein YneR